MPSATTSVRLLASAVLTAHNAADAERLPESRTLMAFSQQRQFLAKGFE
jgi:hypothetical protein